MLRNVVEQNLLESLLRPIKKVYRKLTLDEEPTFVSFDEAFPDVEKYHCTAPEEVSTPEALEMPLWDEAARRKSSTYTVPEGFATILHDVLYYPPLGAIMTDDRQVVIESVRYGTEGIDDLWEWRLRSRDVKPLSGCWAHLGNSYGYYHELIDVLPQVVFLNHSDYSDLDEIKLLGNTSTGMDELLLEEIAPENTRIATPEQEADLYRIENFIFVSHRTRRYSAYLPREYVAHIREKMLPQRSSTREHRILISRENSPKRRMENREELLATLKERGFIKVCPEKLSPQDEIELFYDAEAVVGAHGSGLTNLMFAQQAQVVELFQTSYVIPHFYYLCKSLGHGYAYWCSNGDDRDAASYRVEVAAVLDRLDRMDIR